MGMTITEKILAKHSGPEQVSPGQIVWAKIDVLMTHDVCGPGTIGIFHERFGTEAKVFDPSKVVLIGDHDIHTKDEKCLRNVDVLRAFAKEQGIKYFYEPGTDTYQGVCHVTLPQEGHTRPGEILLGTDSHTCTHGAFGELATGIGNTEAGFVLGTGTLWLRVPETMRFVFNGQLDERVMAKDMILKVIGDIGVDGANYRSMEFAGEAVKACSMEERMTLCNMAIEAGGKNGIIVADEKVEQYLARHDKSGKKYTLLDNDADAKFFSEHEYEAKKIEPMVAQPHSPSNTAPARSLKGVSIERVYIGSCTGGKTTDMAAAASLLAGRSVKTETFVVPATVAVDNDMDEQKIEGQSLREIFIQAGAKIGRPSCAACLGGPADTFGRVNEPLRCVSTTNRNFHGRMGHKSAEIFLESPMTAAATAIKGEITDPRDI